jgi:predicted amidohydrolase
MKDLRLTLVQTPIRWEDPEGARKDLDGHLDAISGPTDLIVLSEMFTTGFSMDSHRLAEDMDGPSVQWMLWQAERLQALVLGSLIIRDGDDIFNRCLCAFPDGSLLHYDKAHLFTLAGEHKHYTRGRARLVFEYLGWRISPFICYDLRFPVWLRNTADIDLMVGVAQFPGRRRKAWMSLLPARAIENVCYVAGVNGLGTDGNGISYSGDSGLWDYEGEPLLQLHSESGTRSATLSHEKLMAFRRAYPFLRDRDEFRM